ncbi:MAG: GntR family transcriptional regulator [Gemmataceae bacterium]|nr:GntR family transcriptional regulator [Gemmataceae bacterium]
MRQHCLVQLEIAEKSVSQFERGEADYPKYLSVADDLAARIRAGEWNHGKVPTVRDIASRYDVSSFTASRALQTLRDRGLVVTRNRSGSYITADRPPPRTSTHSWAVVTHVSPGPWQSASEAVVKVGFERLANAGTFHFYPLEFPTGTPAADLERAALTLAHNGVDGVFFLPSRMSEELCRQDEWFLAGCRKARLPVVLIDRNLRGEGRPLAYDLVASDHFEGGLRCTEHLLDRGRQRVACIVASPTSTHSNRLAGYLFALQHSEPRREPWVIRVPENLDARETYPWIAEQLIRGEADGVICYQDYVAVGVILELFRRGRNVPRDVAVVGCDDLPIGQSFGLGVTTYTYPSEAIARGAVERMLHRMARPDDLPAKLLYPGQLVVRDSTVG